jgi:tetratricopeptide (TPR) repeat protein
MKKIIIIFILCLIQSAKAQDIVTPQNSLLAIWENEEVNDSVRSLALQNFNWNYVLFNNADSSIVLSLLLLDFVNEKNIQGAKPPVLNTLGVAYTLKGEYQTSIDYHEKNNEYSNEKGDLKNAAAALSNIATNYYYLGDINKAIEYTCL